MPALTRVTIKKKLHDLARTWLGLDVHSARHRGFDLEPYRMNAKYTRRLLHFERLLTQVDDLQGRIVECGVGPGRSIFAFSILTQHLARPREIWGFDTFEGMPPPGREDGEHNAHMGGVWAWQPAQVVESLKLAGVSEAFIQANIRFVPGRLQDSLPAYDGGSIAFLHLDVDFYASYKTALEALYRHVVPGGIVAFDEYRQQAWPGATRAIDEFFAQRPEKPAKSPILDLYYVVKNPSDAGIRK